MGDDGEVIRVNFVEGQGQFCFGSGSIMVWVNYGLGQLWSGSIMVRVNYGHG